MKIMSERIIQPRESMEPQGDPPKLDILEREKNPKFLSQSTIGCCEEE